MTLTVRALDAPGIGLHEKLFRDTGAISLLDDPGPPPLPHHSAVAFLGGRAVGCIRIRPDARDGHVIADLRGGVLPEARGQGVGRALIEWFHQAGIAALGSRFVEALVDDGACDEALKSILMSNGFECEEFVELSAPTTPSRAAVLPGLSVRPMAGADISNAAAIHRLNGAMPRDLSEAERHLSAVWNSPYASRAESIVVCEGRAMRGFAVVFRWPDDPNDLWIECLAVDPGGGPSVHDVSRHLLATLRSAPAPTRTVSTGVARAQALQYELAGFNADRTWRRFRQVFVA